MAIKPEDLREDLEAKARGSGAGHASARRNGPAATGLPAAVEDGVIKNIAASYFLLRRGMAAIALLFPLVLWVGAGIDHLQPNISAYYHFHFTGNGPSPHGSGEMRDVFVGVLWAVGTFLFFYRGYSWEEDWILNVAGLAAIFVAVFPSDWHGEPGTDTNLVHFTSAIVFFLAIACVCLFLSGKTLKLMKDEARKRRFKRAYALLGTLMVALPLGLLLLHLLADRVDSLRGADEIHVVLGMEVAVIWVFAIFWLVKSREISILQKQLKGVT